MNLRTVRTILHKELLDTLRDKRTLIMMIAIPVLLYPALMLLGVQLAIFQHKELSATVSRIAVQGEGMALARQWLSKAERLELVKSAKPRIDLQLGKVDAVLVFPKAPQKTLQEKKTLSLTILYDGTEFRSLDAMNRLHGQLDKVYQGELKKRLRVEKLSMEFATPLSIKRNDVAPAEKTTGTLLGMILPMLMVVMLALGAFYPAVDLTAGEKERGTFESLLATPASSLDIVTGKFLAVCSLALCTGILNLASMAATFALLIQQVRPLIDQNIVLTGMMPVRAFAIILIVMVPLAFFISAIMMSIAVYARSFKEAQNYVTPFFLVILLPTSIAALPGVELEGMSRYMPIGNVVLLFKALMVGEATAEAVFIVFTSTALFATLALLFAVWIFQREDIILSEDHGVPFTYHRSAFVPRNVPSVGMALGLFSVVMLLLVYLGSIAQTVHILLGLLFSQWVLIFLPLLLILYFTRINLREAFMLHAVAPGKYFATLLVSIGAILLMLQVAVWHNKFLPFPPEMEEAFAQIFGGAEGSPSLLTLLFVVALTPAICEELLFRGVILSAVRQRWRSWTVVLTIGILFGAFHLTFYRFIPTALLGCVLTYVALRCASIYPAILLHFLNNASAIILSGDALPETWRNTLKLDRLQDTGLPWWLLATATCLFMAGVLMLERAKGKDIR